MRPRDDLRALVREPLVQCLLSIRPVEYVYVFLLVLRQIPINGEPSDVTAIVSDYASWLAENTVPKLFVNAEPGAILTGSVRDFCRKFLNQNEVTVSGTHFIQEDSGAQIGRAIAHWIRTSLY
jgi:haloalkane dehalogenase